MANWLDLAKGKLEADDSILGSYPGDYDGQHGYIILSKKKLLFVAEKGTFKKTIELLLDKPYTQFKGDKIEGLGRLVISDVKGSEYHLKTQFLSAVQNLFEEQRKNIE